MLDACFFLLFFSDVYFKNRDLKCKKNEMLHIDRCSAVSIPMVACILAPVMVAVATFCPTLLCF